jgi:hypothetical protein
MLYGLPGAGPADFGAEGENAGCTGRVIYTSYAVSVFAFGRAVLFLLRCFDFARSAKIEAQKIDIFLAAAGRSASYAGQRIACVI